MFLKPAQHKAGLKERDYMKTNNIAALLDLGQSPWYDNISRELINNGELQRLLDIGITGVTSNPSIFEKAINGSNVYDNNIKDLGKAGKTTIEIYDLITIQDIQLVADLLIRVYKKTGGRDGYVSLEVLPEFAHHTAKTIENAKRLWNEVARPNLMIKVPGTKEGPEAIRALTRIGINVNVTLLFSMRHYETCAKAYMEGLNDRLGDGGAIDKVFSVASVIISRVDTVVDQYLEDTKKERLQGKIAVANAKKIYQRFKELFYGKEFTDLKHNGGNIQRVLWGSTSPKNPDYSDVKYVNELIGKDTVNTLPHKTLKAFLDHGKPDLTIEQDLEQEARNLRELKDLKIDLNKICDNTQEKGVEAFADSFKKLIEAIKAKELKTNNS